VVQPAQDRVAKYGPGQFDGARARRVLLHAECGKNLGSEKHEISDRKLRHHQTEVHRALHEELGCLADSTAE
jgi:hypothetical protein